ncbi:UNVERIFIED_CONTAM: hypothetical protein FKN15_007132 [Acipenser sinensis]
MPQRSLSHSRLSVPCTTRSRSAVGGKGEDSTVTMELITRRPLTSDLVNLRTGSGSGSGSSNGEVPTEITMPALGSPTLFKLRDRTLLTEEKRRLCGWALGIALFGILLMILQTELCWFVCGKGSVSVFIVRLLISLSTVCLLGLLVAFHYKDIRTVLMREVPRGRLQTDSCCFPRHGFDSHLAAPRCVWRSKGSGFCPGPVPAHDPAHQICLAAFPREQSITRHRLFCIVVKTVGRGSSLLCPLFAKAVLSLSGTKVFMIDHSVEDWRIALTARRVLSISLELGVCALHPLPLVWLPGSWEDGEGVRRGGGWNSTLPSPLACSLAAWELLPCFLMFLRLYLVHRTLLLHSKTLLSASYRSIGSLNNIDFQFRFVLKVLMNTHPGRTLLAFIVCFWLTSSWLLTLCERQSEASVGRMEDTMWLIAITFLTIGYGDITPQTTCGKTVCLLTGVMVGTRFRAERNLRSGFTHFQVLLAARFSRGAFRWSSKLRRVSLSNS